MEVSGVWPRRATRLLRETLSRLRVAGQQVLLRPSILRDAVRSLSLKALYLPDQKRILLDRDLPLIKHRWNEAHEIGHDLIPWHSGMMLGDTSRRSRRLATRLSKPRPTMRQVNSSSWPTVFEPRRPLALRASRVFGNTVTSTLWRFVEQAHGDRPMVALVAGHPHPAKRNRDFDAAKPSPSSVVL
jgi:hypothetical protein